MDWEDPVSDSPNCTSSTELLVLQTNLPISEEDYMHLQNNLVPLSESVHYGIDLYETTPTFVCNNLTIN